MARAGFHCGEQHLKEILDFDILFRINANQDGETSVLLERANAWLEPHFQSLHQRQLLEISERDRYALSQKGKILLTKYGVMFQCFKDLSIFKCVYPDAEAPQEGQPDLRFGSYHDQAKPPHSEDYRVLVFENFCKRENRVAPLHLFVFFSLVENMRPLQSEDDWIWALESGELLDNITSIIHSQPSAEDICPDGMHPDDMVDAIYQAGVDEVKRCAQFDREKYDPDQIQRDQEDFFQETITVEVEESGGHDMPEPPPQWDHRASIAPALCAGAFAGLATCALLS